jgi:hypothetical protein
MTASGTVIVSIPAGAVVDASNNPNTASTSSDNTVTFTPAMMTTGQITPLSATCAQFAAGTAPDQNDVVYNHITLWRNRHRVISVDPNAFLYYSKVIAPAASFQIRVSQSNTGSWPNLLSLQNYVYDANCTRINLRRAPTVGSNTITFNVTNAMPGAVYYVGIRYLAASVLLREVTSPYPTVPYTFTTALNNTLLDSNTDSISFHP